MQNKNIVFIGGGNMAAAIIGGLVSSGWNRANISVVELLPERRAFIETEFSVGTTEHLQPALSNADVVVLAVKPQSFQAVAESVRDAISSDFPLILSVAAGIEIQHAVSWMNCEPAMIRVMPNTPALINKGVSGLFANAKASAEDCDLAESIMQSVGSVVWVESEPLIDSVTAVSGSGPAYFFRLMELMIEQAQVHGLNKSQAHELVVQTAIGAANLAGVSDHSPGTLREQVTSPNGTTQAALEAMNTNGIETCIHSAVDAAVARSKSLAAELGG
ncbi:MAG: pyrroline-5-carboxylate reductase [Pseudomonadota bacterium]